MRPRSAWLCCLLVLSLAVAGRPLSAAEPALVAPTEALSPAEQQQLFRLPPGFEIRLVAAEPDIHKPMNIAFDHRGRLWVTSTVEYPYPAKPGVVPRDTVKVLTDTNGDGAADEIVTFADGLNIPLGVFPLPDGALVYGIPAIWRFRDADGDGVADSREVAYATFEHRDTHGMVNSFTRALDGWIYTCHGFANNSSAKGTDGQSITMNSGNTFRMKPDGSHLEYHTHGQVNPFGLTLDPLGNLYSADCHSKPIYQLLRGAYYPSFGKPHDGLDFGPDMIAHDHGSTGIGGIAYYAAEQFPAEYRDNVFIGNPVTGRVNRDRLEPHGSTLRAVEMPDLVSCDDPWFRPVNLQLGPDGALYIADFYNCIIGHYEVPLEHPRRDRQRGRIWRVTYAGQGVAGSREGVTHRAAAMVRVQAMPPEQLVAALGSENLTVRTQATHELVDRVGPPAVDLLRKLLASPSASAPQRAHGLWALERIAGLDAAQVTRLADDGDRLVRVHLVKALAERGQWNAALAQLVRDKLRDSDAFVRRAAADALGRHPDRENVIPLLKAWQQAPADDTHLIHVVRMALRDHLAAPGLVATAVAAVGDDRDRLGRLADVALGAPTSDVAGLLLAMMERGIVPADSGPHWHHVVRYCAPESVGPAIERALGHAVAPGQRAQLVREIGRAVQERGMALPSEVQVAAAGLVAQLLAGAEEPAVRLAIEMAREFPSPGTFDRLAQAAGPAAPFAALRPQAIDACIALDAGRAVDVVRAIMDSAAEPVPLRQFAAVALGRINTEASRAVLAAELETASEQLAIAIAIALGETREGAELLLAATERGKSAPRLLQEPPVLERVRARGIGDVEHKLATLTAGLEPRDERIRQLIEQRKAAFAAAQTDAVRGAKAFEKVCAACHRIGEVGAKIGPDLNGVGLREVERLLEDVLDPNRNVDQTFRTTQVVTADGRVFTGLALREEGNVLVLADNQGKEVRVNVAEIDQRQTTQLSLMPTNLSEQLTEPEFLDLLAFLKSHRQKPAP